MTHRYVALLRAVNVGGTGKLPMAELKAMCEDAGFDAVRTYIASGNVVFASPHAEAAVRQAEVGLNIARGYFADVYVTDQGAVDVARQNVLTTLSANGRSAGLFSITVEPGARGTGISVPIPATLRHLVEAHNLAVQYAPVRDGDRTVPGLIVGEPVSARTGVLDLYYLFPLTAEEQTIVALFPPSSSSTRPNRWATRGPTARPIAVDPVAETSATRGSSTSASPMFRSPWTIWTSPSGASPKRSRARPTSCITSSAQSGVFSLGFQITGSPQTSARAAFQAHTATGKLKALMTSTGPSGCHCSIIRWFGRSLAIVSP